MNAKLSQKSVIQNFPEDIQGLPRRRFLKQLLGSTAAAAALPSFGFGEQRDALKDLKDAAGGHSGSNINEERFWRLVKEQFLIRKGLIMLNAANLCPSPYPVQQMVFKLTRDLDADPSFANRAKYGELREKARSALAEFLGASLDEIAITRNTSEGNNIVIGGLTFKPGDEVIIWDENHPTANIAWDVRAERYGFTVKRVKVPAIFESAEKLIKPFRDAMTKRTRIMCFSHVSNATGIALPAKDICKMARERNVFIHIDGAQTFGAQVVNLHDIGCDFYTGSAHKWFVGPKEAGVLYVRKERVADLWPSIVGVGYPRSLERGARKFETLGQRDEARVTAMGTTVEFHNLIGKTRIEARVRNLAAALKEKLQKRIPSVKFITPLASEFSGGVVAFNPPGIDLSKALNTLYHDHNIGCAVYPGDSGRIRLCPHLYNTMDEIDKTVHAVASLMF